MTRCDLEAGFRTVRTVSHLVGVEAWLSAPGILDHLCHNRPEGNFVPND